MTDSPVDLHHVEDGPRDAPPLLLAPSIGTTLSVWEPQVAAFSEHHRVIRLDTRGHGRSPIPTGPYTLAALTADVLRLADALGLDRFAYAGISLGGAVGQVLAAEHPDRVSSLLLCATGPSFGPARDWLDRADRVRSEGMDWLVRPSRERWFPPSFLRRHPDRAQALLDTFAATPREGYAACCAALAECDLLPLLPRITAPTRVIAGADDPVSGPGVGRVLAGAIPGADLVVLDDAAHLVNVPRPDAFTTAALTHLEQHRAT